MMDKKIARVFPRKTKVSPIDELSFFGLPPRLILPKIDEVHVSVTFSWDLDKAEWLADQWQTVAPVKIGGPGVVLVVKFLNLECIYLMAMLLPLAAVQTDVGFAMSGKETVIFANYLFVTDGTFWTTICLPVLMNTCD
jgi:hypothetical protein